MPYGKELLLIAVAYGLGCLTTGYYVVRLWTGEDIRCFGSGNLGARNVGRKLGWKGFVLTFSGDAAKGALAVGLGYWFKVDDWAMALQVLAVIVGHLWPLQLRFQGGKGIATTLAAILVYDYRMAVALVALFAVIFLVLRKFSLSGLLAFCFLPPAAWALPLPALEVAVSICLAVLILIAHRKNIRQESNHLIAWAQERKKDLGRS